MIPSDSADAVAAIHVLEHFHYWEVEPLLTEWKRILKPGGKMILELPCMDKVFGYVVQCIQTGNDMASFMTLLAMYGDPRHKDPLQCHKWGWFSRPLRDMLEKIGMREIVTKDALYHFKFRDMRFEAVK
jgi:SAM-dependent methyltransferase